MLDVCNSTFGIGIGTFDVAVAPSYYVFFPCMCSLFISLYLNLTNAPFFFCPELKAIRDDSYFAGIEGITSYALEGSSLLPTGVTFDAATGSFTGTPITVCSVGACIEKYSVSYIEELSRLSRLAMMRVEFYCVPRVEWQG